MNQPNTIQTGEEKRIISMLTRKLIPFLILIYVVAYIDRSTLGFAKLHMNSDVGISDAAYGLGAGLFFIGYFLFEVPSNLFLTRYGARRWFARILVSWGVVTIAMALISNATSFYVLRFLLGAAEAGLYPGVLYFLTQWFPVRHRGRIIGAFILSQPIALIVTGPLAGMLLGLEGLAGLHGWQWLFIITGAPAVLLAWPTLRLLSDGPRQAAWLPRADADWIEAQLAEDLRIHRPTAHHNPLHALKDRRVLLMALYYLPFPLSIYGLSLWLPTIIKGFGVSDQATGWLSAIPYIFAVIGLFVIPRSSDRFNERYGHIAVASALGAAGLCLSAVLSAPAMQLAALSLTAFAVYAAQAVLWTLPGRFLTGATAAAGIALINATGNLGGYIGPFVVGLIKERTGSLSSGLYFLAAVLVCAILLTFVVRRVIDGGKGGQGGERDGGRPEDSKRSEPQRGAVSRVG